jgi:hypothetical protein
MTSLPRFLLRTIERTITLLVLADGELSALSVTDRASLGLVSRRHQGKVTLRRLTVVAPRTDRRDRLSYRYDGAFLRDGLGQRFLER